MKKTRNCGKRAWVGPDGLGCGIIRRLIRGLNWKCRPGRGGFLFACRQRRVLKEAAPRRGRRVSQLSETLAASVAKKRERLVQVKGLTRYGKRHPRIQPKNTPRGPLKNGSKNRTQVPVPARARVYGSDPVRVQGGVPTPPCDPPPSPGPPRCGPPLSDGGPANSGFWSAAAGPGFWFGCCCCCCCCCCC